MTDVASLGVWPLGTFAWCVCVRSARTAPFRTRSLRAAFTNEPITPRLHPAPRLPHPSRHGWCDCSSLTLRHEQNRAIVYRIRKAQDEAEALEVLRRGIGAARTVVNGVVVGAGLYQAISSCLLTQPRAGS